MVDSNLKKIILSIGFIELPVSLEDFNRKLVRYSYKDYTILVRFLNLKMKNNDKYRLLSLSFPEEDFSTDDIDEYQKKLKLLFKYELRKLKITKLISNID